MAPFGFDAPPILPLRVAIPERNAPLGLDSSNRVIVGDEVSLAVGDGEFDHLARRVAAGERRLGVLDPDVLHFADEAELRVAHQHAGQKAGFAKDLKAVADPEHEAPARSVVGDRPHDRRSRGDCAAAQIVTVREAARQDDEIEARRQFVFGVPDDRRLDAGRLAKGARDVAFPIDSGEQDHAHAHGAAHVISIA